MNDAFKGTVGQRLLKYVLPALSDVKNHSLPDYLLRGHCPSLYRSAATLPNSP